MGLFCCIQWSQRLDFHGTPQYKDKEEMIQTVVPPNIGVLRRGRVCPKLYSFQKLQVPFGVDPELTEDGGILKQKRFH